MAPTRFAGNDRYDTAAKIATGTYAASDTVVIASGETYPDALAGAYAAGLASVPVLLVTRDDVPTSTAFAVSPGTSTYPPGTWGSGRVRSATPPPLSSPTHARRSRGAGGCSSSCSTATTRAASEPSACSA